MKKFIAGILGCIFGAVLAGSGGYWYFYHQSAAKPVDVYPSTLNTKPSMELADLILDIMGKEKEGWWWNWQANSNIVWEDGISYGNEISSRTGSVRVNVLGKTSTVLKDREKELGWSIALKSTDMPAKFGPDTIELAPNGCFGMQYEGCTFDTLKSLDRKGISHNTICKVYTGGGENRITYVLHYPLHADVAMTVFYNAGSGGDSNEISFQKGGTEEANTICNKGIDSNLSLSDKEAITHQNFDSGKKHTEIAEDFLRKLSIDKVFEGKSCLIYLIANEFGKVIDISSDKHGFEPLCGKAIDVLSEVEFPKTENGNHIFFSAIISR